MKTRQNSEQPALRRISVRSSIRRRRSPKTRRTTSSRAIPDDPVQLGSIRPNRQLIQAAARRARRRVVDQNDIPAERRRSIICDGESVAYDDISETYQAGRIEKAVNFFENLGHSTMVVVPQYLQDKAANAYFLDNLANQGKLIRYDCDSGTAILNMSLERQLLTKAVDDDAAVISEREFEIAYYDKTEYQTVIDQRVIGFCFFKEEIFIPVDPYGRYGPLLNDILRK